MGAIDIAGVSEITNAPWRSMTGSVEPDMVLPVKLGKKDFHTGSADALAQMRKDTISVTTEEGKLPTGKFHYPHISKASTTRVFVAGGGGALASIAGLFATVDGGLTSTFLLSFEMFALTSMASCVVGLGTWASNEFQDYAHSNAFRVIDVDFLSEASRSGYGIGPNKDLYNMSVAGIFKYNKENSDKIELYSPEWSALQKLLPNSHKQPLVIRLHAPMLSGNRGLSIDYTVHRETIVKKTIHRYTKVDAEWDKVFSEITGRYPKPKQELPTQEPVRGFPRFWGKKVI